MNVLYNEGKHQLRYQFVARFMQKPNKIHLNAAKKCVEVCQGNLYFLAYVWKKWGIEATCVLW